MARGMMASPRHPKVAIEGLVHGVGQCALLRKRILNSAISKGTLLASITNPASEVHFVPNDGCKEKAKYTVNKYQGRNENNKGKRNGFKDQVDFVVFVHDLRCCLIILKEYICFVVRIPLSTYKEYEIREKYTASKEGQQVVGVICEKRRNQQKTNTNNAAYNFERMCRIRVFKLLKKPVEFLRLSRHFFSLKSLINSTSNRTFLTNHAK